MKNTTVREHSKLKSNIMIKFKIFIDFKCIEDENWSEWKGVLVWDCMRLQFQPEPKLASYKSYLDKYN